MSAPPAGSANGSPLPGYYPDPSIPGYIRYWDGTQWVPGTSRPQPGPGEPPPEPPAPRGGASRGAASRGGVPPQHAATQQQSAPPVPEETGPVFLDEDDGRGDGGLPEVRQRGDVASREEEHAQQQAADWDDPRRPHDAGPAAGGGAWRADASRQSGFGGEQDQRVSWGAEEQQRPDAAASAPAPPDSGDTIGIRLPRDGMSAQQQAQQTPQAQAYRQAPQQGQGGPGVGAQQQPPPVPQPQHGQAAPPWQGAGPQSARPPAQPQTPQQAPQQAERPPWAQQVHDLAQNAPGPVTAGPEHVAPWRPPADDPFLRAAQAQARPAGLGRRFGAALLDGVLFAAVVAAAAFPFVGKATDHIQEEIDAARQAGVTRRIWLVDGTTGVYLAVVLGAFLVFGLLYEALPTAKWGRTLGKKLFGLTVLDVERQDPPRFGAALRRWLVHRLLGVLVIGVVDVLWCLFDRPWRQCWHDKAARTFVSRGTTAD